MDQPSEQHGDHVDRILAEWIRERPELDVRPMSVIGRVRRLGTFFLRRMEDTWARYGLNVAGFDVLSTLLRVGPPYSLSPGELLASTMVTSGTMTHRIDQLERAGLVVRRANREDGRSVLIALTDRGRRLIEEALAAHVETQGRLVSSLTPEERRTLAALLKKMLTAIEKPKGGGREPDA
ncbi:MAG: MarR family transcriptional regulator [Rhodospirillales bacterium CG15_BIG_FIL_POST_REV_8_21_14_020_66_15]|nr:MAG: MarR family transcriptional regulator [Rhodospirillales bacterium CG15_BIG_FIL_POST_REV_8_21_14_020_66_15]